MVEWLTGDGASADPSVVLVEVPPSLRVEAEEALV